MSNKLLTISTILPVAAILIIAACFSWQPDYIGENCALYLDSARLLLSGQKQYIDFIDLNPPLATYLACLPVLAAQMLKLPVVSVFHTMVLLVVAFSVLLTTKLCAMLYRQNVDDAFLLLPSALALSNLPLLFWFGERDHLIVLALVPFLLLRMFLYGQNSQTETSPPRTLQVTIALFTGLALALKPQCGLIALLSELCLIATAWPKKPRLSLDLLLLLLVPALYGLHFFILPPAETEAYFGWLLPLLSGYYNAFNVPFLSAAALYTYFGPMLRSFIDFLALVVLAIFGRKKSTVLSPLIAFALGSYFVYLIQAKGWGYQTIEATTSCFLLSAALIPIFLRKLLAKANKSLSTSQAKILLIEAALLVAICPVFALDSSLTGKELSDCDQWIKQYTKPGESVMIISSAVAPAYPSLFLLDRKNGSRYLWAAPLVMLEYGKQMIRDQADLEKIEALERPVLERLEQDIHQRRPKLVMIECFQSVGAQNLFDLMVRRGIVQNDLGAYTRLGLCNRFVGFLYDGSAAAPFNGSYADLTPSQSNSENTIKSSPKQQFERMECFRLAEKEIARADRNILLKPSDQDFINRAAAYAKICMYQKAEDDFEKALQLSESDRAYIGLGYCQLHLQNYQDSIKGFTRALAIQSSSQAHAGLASALCAQGDYKNARGQARLALKNPESTGRQSSPPILNLQPAALAHCVLAFAYRKEGKLDEAASEADLAIKNNPGAPDGYLEKACVLYGLGHFQEMLHMADEAVSRDYSRTDGHSCRELALRGLHLPQTEYEQTIFSCLRGKE